MKDTEFHKKNADKALYSSRMYSPTLQPLLQSLLSTLADIDFDYELEREKLSGTSQDNTLKIRALEKLRSRHRERREPYIQQLAILQRRMMELKAQ
jgi:hypothetical protein